MSVYDYDAQIDGLMKRMETELSEENCQAIKKYDKTMVGLSMSKAVRVLHLRILLNLSKMFGKNWEEEQKLQEERNLNKKEMKNVMERLEAVEYGSQARQNELLRAVHSQDHDDMPNDPIKHVIVLMLENNSFDHILGSLTQII